MDIFDEDAEEADVSQEEILKTIEVLNEIRTRKEPEFTPEKIAQVIEQLDERSRKIITFRFGLDGGGGKTLEDCALEFNVTRERVRQIESRFIAKLRHPKG